MTTPQNNCSDGGQEAMSDKAKNVRLAAIRYGDERSDGNEFDNRVRIAAAWDDLCKAIDALAEDKAICKSRVKP